jgi:predicted ATPase
MTPLPVRAVRVQDQEPVPQDAWFAQVPAVAQVLREGWPLDQVTVLVGDNGTGKSTLVEAVAMMFGMAAEGGSTGSMHATRRTESELWRYLRLEREIGAPRAGFFLRAETMHAFYSYLEANPGGPEPVFHEMSHGESFLALATDRMKPQRPGLFVLDEPESALSFTGCLGLVGHLTSLVRSSPSQVLLSTHSPVLAAIPGATIYEVGDWGLRRCAWDDLELVQRYRGFLDDPRRYLRHVVEE